jgi:uncharacterized RDD family membrane protein YckC
VWCIQLWCQGKTPGKQAVGIRVIDLETGQPAGFLRNGLLRELLVSWFIYPLPFIGIVFQLAEIIMLFQPGRRTPRDLMACTIVVRDRQ